MSIINRNEAVDHDVNCFLLPNSFRERSDTMSVSFFFFFFAKWCCSLKSGRNHEIKKFPVALQQVNFSNLEQFSNILILLEKAVGLASIDYLVSEKIALQVES